MSSDITATAVSVASHRFFEVAADVMLVATIDAKFEDVNPAFTAALGWTLDELQGTPVLSFVHFGDRESTGAELAKLRQGTTTVAFENRFRAKDGGLKRFAWSVRMADGRIFAIGRDVPAVSLTAPRSTSADGAAESDLLPNRVVYDGNPHTGAIRYEENVSRLLGGEPGDFAEGFRCWRERVHPDDLVAYDQTVGENLARRRAFHMDYRMVRRDGTAVRVQDVGQFRFDADHRVCGVVGYVTPAVGRGGQAERERVTGYYRALAECGLALSSTRSLNEIHQLITDHARGIVGAHQSVTALTADANFVMAVNALALSDKYAPWRAYAVVPDGTGIYAMICETNRPGRMTQAEMEAHPRWRGFGKERDAHPPMRGWLAAPLIGSNGNNLGLIQLSDKYEGEFDETDEAILVQLAKMAAAAIENAHLHRDIEAARRELEEKVEARTADLAAANRAMAASNADLEQFAFAASHDLQEPLRAIAGYCQLLQRQYAAQLDAKADGYIKNAVAGIDRMSSLINDLLEFARVSRHGNPFRPADFNLVVREALAHLQTAVAESVATVEFRGLPTLRADKGQMVRLFQNLIGNAIKYRGPPPPAVRITAEEKPGETVFAVRDNGIGMEPKYFDRIFVIFQRLHTREEYPGTGIGLAVCKRIVERHGGRIWVESEPGQGTTFYFSIKKSLGEQS